MGELRKLDASTSNVYQAHQEIIGQLTKLLEKEKKSGERKIIAAEHTLRGIFTFKNPFLFHIIDRISQFVDLLQGKKELSPFLLMCAAGKMPLHIEPNGVSFWDFLQEEIDRVLVRVQKA